MNKQSKKIALCGLVSALSVTVMLCGFLFPFATYAAPAMAAILIMPIVWEYKEKTALTMYVAVSFLSFFVVPDKELVLMYVLLFGLYTVYKLKIDRLKNKWFKLLIKLLYVNISLAVIYSLLILIFPVQALLNEFATYGTSLILGLVIMFNITFLIYDKAVEKLLIIYVYKLRKKIFKK